MQHPECSAHYASVQVGAERAGVGSSPAEESVVRILAGKGFRAAGETEMRRQTREWCCMTVLCFALHAHSQGSVKEGLVKAGFKYVWLKAGCSRIKCHKGSKESRMRMVSFPLPARSVVTDPEE